jgi:hypothetical protein
MKIKTHYLLSTLILLSVVFYTNIHTHSLDVTHHQITLGTGTNHLLIAHISDLHTKGLNSIEQQMLNTLKKHKPDIIFITGDLANPNGSLNGYIEVLSQLNAPKGIFFVNGNWEYWAPIDEIQTILDKYNITNLTNKTLKLNNEIMLAGYDDSQTGNPKFENNLQRLHQQYKVISLFHSPQFFEQLSDKTHLAFAGHTHGGQIRIPLIGSLWLPAGSGKYDQGWWEINEAKMYVSRGIGTSLIPVRFNCSPELAFIKITY